jgi:L-threonylcarbamoyladenylate synthase
MADPFVILFVCTGNTCRSPMAEAALKVLLSKERPGMYEIISAGTGAATGFPATMYAAEVVKVWNADLSHHRSTQLSRSLIDRADLILGMSAEHVREVVKLAPSARDRTYLFKNFPDKNPHGEPVYDPIGQAMERYNETFLDIGEYLGKHLPLIVQMIDEKQAKG